jgi:hypothetical protein
MQYPQTDQQTLPITPDYWHRDAIAANLAASVAWRWTAPT